MCLISLLVWNQSPSSVTHCPMRTPSSHLLGLLHHLQDNFITLTPFTPLWGYNNLSQATPCRDMHSFFHSDTPPRLWQCPAPPPPRVLPALSPSRWPWDRAAWEMQRRSGEEMGREKEGEDPWHVQRWKSGWWGFIWGLVKGKQLTNV